MPQLHNAPAAHPEAVDVAEPVRHDDDTRALTARARAAAWVPRISGRVARGFTASSTQYLLPESDRVGTNDSLAFDVQLTFSLEHAVFSPQELDILRLRAQQAAQRRALNGEAEDAAETPANGDGEETAGEVELGAKRLEMQLAEQFILTVSEKGYGKRSSSFEYRVTGRGGKGIVAMVVNERNGKLIASFPVEDRDQIMLVTDGGQVIRVPVDAGPGNRIRIAGRSTQGVTVFNTDASEKVVSVERIGDDGEGEDAEAEGAAAPESPGEA